MRKNITVIAGSIILSINTISAQNTWTLKNPAIHPPQMYAHGMAWAGEDKIVLFGGQKPDFSCSSETWVYDISDDTWTQKFPAITPSSRYHLSMAFVEEDKVFLFGGASCNNELLNDTWVYDLSDNTWTLKSPATSPGPRQEAAVAHLDGDRILLFGGLGGNDETWIYDLSDNNWTQKFPANAPITLAGGYNAAKIGNGKVIWNGEAINYTAQTIGNETWIYDQAINNWTNQNPSPFPNNPLYHRLSYLGGDKVLSFGGMGLSETENCWIYDLSDNIWSLISVYPNPGSYRNIHNMASAGNKVVLFAGIGNFGSGYPIQSDTWLFTADASCSMEVSAGADEHLLFGYAPDQCVTKTAAETGGTGPFSYNWTLNRALLPGETMTGNTTASVTVCLMDTAALCVTVTDANSCTATDCAMVFAEDVRCGTGNNQKVTICHNGNTICVDASAVGSHIAHGDYVGSCATVAGRQRDNGEQADGFTLFPNPGKGEITVSFNKPGFSDGNTILQIINSSGQVVKTINTGSRNLVQFRMDVPGVYIARIINGKIAMQKRFVIVK